MFWRIIIQLLVLVFACGCNSTTSKKIETLTMSDSSQMVAMKTPNNIAIRQQYVDSLLRRIFVCEVILDNQRKTLKEQEDSIRKLNTSYFECKSNGEEISEILTQTIADLQNRPIDSIDIFSAKNLKYFSIDSLAQYISEVRQKENIITESQTPEHIKKIKQASALMLKEPVKFEMIGSNSKNIYLNIFNATKIDNYILLGIRLLDVTQQLKEEEIEELLDDINVIYTHAPYSKKQAYVVAFPLPDHHNKFSFTLKTTLATLKLSLSKKILQIQ